MTHIETLRLDTKSLLAAGSFQELGLSSKTKQIASGLLATTQYYFKINTAEYTFTTASDVTLGAVIALMNTAIAAVTTMEFVLIGGDIRLINEGSSTDITAGTTGTDLLATLTGFTSTDSQVQNVPIVKFTGATFNAARNEVVQIRVIFPITFTGTLYWVLQKGAASQIPDQYYDSGALTAENEFSTNDTKHDDLPLYIQSGDTLKFYTSAACAGTIWIEVAYFGDKW